MCKYCDIKSNDCMYFEDGLTHDWYLEVRTDEYDHVAQEWIYTREYYVKYCTFCGRDLEAEHTHGRIDFTNGSKVCFPLGTETVRSNLHTWRDAILDENKIVNKYIESISEDTGIRFKT